MQAKALVCDEKLNFTLEEVLVPEPGPEQIAVRTHSSGVSIGTEFAVITNKLHWGDYPLTTGYMGTGMVEAVGSNVDNFKVGDIVYYRRNGSITLADGRKVSPLQGVHCSHAVFEPNTDHGAALLPAGVPEDVGSMFVMPAVGLYGVDMANPRMGDVVVVYGVGLIGLGVVAACVHRGCVVVAVDINDMRLAIAEEFGADIVLNGKKHDVPGELRKVAPEGAEVVFEATGIPEMLDPAIALCRPFGTFVWQGNYGEKPVSIRFLNPHGKRLKMFFPCDDGLRPCRQAVLKNMASGALRWEKTITHRISYQESPGMFESIKNGTAPDVLGVVINWQEAG